jgi:hypothetical protein
MIKVIFVLVSSLFAVACSTDAAVENSSFSSQVTQSWSFNPASGAVSAFAESSDACASQIPSTSLSSGHCFNPTPVAEISASVAVGQILSLCVATHEQGSASSASLVVLDQNGQLVSEAFGNGRMQIIATFAGSGRFKVYAGFASPAAGQRVKVLAGFSQQFAISSTACTLR